MSDLHEFIDYVWSFYNTKDGLYPIEGITKEMILEASWLYLQMCYYKSQPNYLWGDGDSLDRERVRDIILNAPKFVEDRQLNCVDIIGSTSCALEVK